MSHLHVSITCWVDCVQGNAIYNIMADIISRLSDPDVGVAEEDFRTIMR